MMKTIQLPTIAPRRKSKGQEKLYFMKQLVCAYLSFEDTAVVMIRAGFYTSLGKMVECFSKYDKNEPDSCTKEKKKKKILNVNMRLNPDVCIICSYFSNGQNIYLT